MSSVIADVVEVESVEPHPNADRLFLARLKGWQAVIRKRDDGSPEFAVGERVVFIPPDSTLPRAMAERLGVVSYLALDYDDFAALCERHGVDTVPILYRGPFSRERIAELSRGQTTLADQHIREGVAVRPVRERFDPKIGRVIPSNT